MLQVAVVVRAHPVAQGMALMALEGRLGQGQGEAGLQVAGAPEGQVGPLGLLGGEALGAQEGLEGPLVRLVGALREGQEGPPQGPPQRQEASCAQAAS